MSGLRIFVSHSHVDNNFCLRLVRDLRRMVRDKDAVWMDTYGLQAGEAWWPKIEREIADRPIFIVILSPDAMKSKWVRDEINIAWSQKNSALGKVIVPVIHKDCELPPALATIQAVSFASPRQYRDALQGLRHALGMPKLASSRRHITLTSAVEDGPRGAELAALAVHSSQGAEALRNPITNLDPVERSMSSKLSVPPTPEKQAALTSPEELVTQDEFESIREHVKAADLLDWVAQIGMDDEDVWINVGETLRKAKKRKEALLAVGFAIALNPQDASAWTLRGQLLDDLGRHEEALAALIVSNRVWEIAAG